MLKQKTINIRTGDRLIFTIQTNTAVANFHNVIGYSIKTSVTTSGATADKPLNEEIITLKQLFL